MKMKLTIIASLTIASLLFAVYQPGNAVTYYGHDGSVDDHLTKVKVEPYKGKKDLWAYTVKACATEYNLAIAAVTLKSDMTEIVQNVNKTIKKGDCSYYGAVIKAKDGKTLGAELIEKHEALQKYFEMRDSVPDLNKKQQKAIQKEITQYRIMLGGLV